MSKTINIAGLDRGEVLAALYNNSRPQGMGILHFDPTPMTAERARELLAERGNVGGKVYFDYLQGRVMKVEFRADSEELDPRLYDRDLGEGAAARVINSVRSAA